MHPHEFSPNMSPKMSPTTPFREFSKVKLVVLEVDLDRPAPCPSGPRGPRGAVVFFWKLDDHTSTSDGQSSRQICIYVICMCIIYIYIYNPVLKPVVVRNLEI